MTERRSAADERGEPAGQPLPRGRLLFVDDEPVNCVNFRLTFEDEYEILTAASGPEALALLEREQEIDILLTDQRMPGMSGVELCVASLARRPDCQRWIITAYADLDDILSAINRAHIQYYVLKPWDSEQLRLMLSQGMQARRLARINRQLQEDLARRNRALDSANARLMEVEGRLRALSASLIQAQETERRRIALELHDELGQELTALKLGLHVLESSWRQCCPTPPQLERQTTELRQQLSRAMENVRRLSQDLSPIQIVNLGIDSAIEDLFDKICRRGPFASHGQRARLAPHFSLTGQHLLYRIIQEGLNNIVKHSRARCVTLNIEHRPGSVVLRLEDDGQGFDPAKIAQEGEGLMLGLSAMEERARMLGGQLTVTSRMGQGCRLEVTLPTARAGDGPEP